jgi:catalase
MLQARLFSYGDTQRYRLGVNFNHIPVFTFRTLFLGFMMVFRSASLQT